METQGLNPIIAETEQVLSQKIAEGVALLDRITAAIDAEATDSDLSIEELFYLLMSESTERDLSMVFHLEEQIHACIRGKIKEKSTEIRGITNSVDDWCKAMKRSYPVSNRPLMAFFIQEIMRCAIVRDQASLLKDLIMRMASPGRSQTEMMPIFNRVLEERARDPEAKKYAVELLYDKGKEIQEKEGKTNESYRADVPISFLAHLGRFWVEYFKGGPRPPGTVEAAAKRKSQADALAKEMEEIYLAPNEETQDCTTPLGSKILTPLKAVLFKKSGSYLPPYNLAHVAIELDLPFKKGLLQLSISRPGGELVFPNTIGISAQEILGLYEPTGTLYQQLRFMALQAVKQVIDSKMWPSLSFQTALPLKAAELMEATQKAVATTIHEPQPSTAPLLDEKEKKGPSRKLAGMSAEQAVAVFETFGVTSEDSSSGTHIKLVRQGDGPRLVATFPKPGGHGSGKAWRFLTPIILAACQRLKINPAEFKRKAAELDAK